MTRTFVLHEKTVKQTLQVIHELVISLGIILSWLRAGSGTQNLKGEQSFNFGARPELGLSFGFQQKRTELRSVLTTIVNCPL